MLDGLRESLNRVPPAVAYTVTLVVVLAAGIFIYMQLSPAAPPTGSVVPAEGMTTIQCRNCGATFKESTAELVQKKYLDPVEHVYLLGEGRKCPECGRYTLQVVEEVEP